MRKTNKNVPYRALEILSDWANYGVEYDWDYADTNGPDYDAMVAIDGWFFDIRVRVKGESYRGYGRDPFYRYEGCKQTGLEVLSIIIRSEEDGNFEYKLTEGYEFSEAAQSIIHDNDDAFSYEEWY